MVHIPAFCPDQFTHPKAYTGCLRLFLPVATSALGISFQDAVAIQPSGLLPNALERLQARTATGNGFDLRKIYSLMLTGPRDLGFYYPMRFHKLGTYELRGRHAALFAANLRAIDNLSPRTASRLVHRLGESSTPQAWEQQHREFLANGGLAPGLEGDLYFISQELFANKLHACPPPFYSQEQLSKIWKERSFAKLYLLNDEHMEDPDGAYRMALDSWTPPDWRAGTSSSRAWWH